MAAEIQDGAVIVARAILNSSLWTMRMEDRILAITGICIANHRAATWFDGEKPVSIERGQFIRSWAGLARAAGMSVKTTRTSSARLEKVGFWARMRAGSYSHFTIPKYAFYQDMAKYSDSVGRDTGSNRADTGQAPGNKQEWENGGMEEKHILPKSNPIRDPQAMILWQVWCGAHPGFKGSKGEAGFLEHLREAIAEGIDITALQRELRSKAHDYPANAIRTAANQDYGKQGGGEKERMICGVPESVVIQRKAEAEQRQRQQRAEYDAQVRREREAKNNGSH